MDETEKKLGMVHLPNSLLIEVKTAAKENEQSIRGFVRMAVKEKLKRVRISATRRNHNGENQA
jgi:hypothetical protein